MGTFKFLMFAGAVLSINSAAADSMGEMCNLLKDPSLPASMRKGLEMRCSPLNSVAKTAYIKNGKGYVVSAGKIIEIVDGVGDDWTISYAEGQFYFNPPRTAGSQPDAPSAAR